LSEGEGVQRNFEFGEELTTVFWIFLTLWLSNSAVKKGIFQVQFGLIKSERTRLVELGESEMIGVGVNASIDGIHGEFQMGMGERE
jgi:hypothetical protein